MPRQISEAAQAAKIIRKHIRQHGIKASVRSSTYSMGSSVGVNLTDEIPATVKLIESYCSQFQYGSFDGMIDLYTCDNKKEGIPQAKFVSVNVKYSDELQQDAWDYIRSYLAGFEKADDNFTNATSFYNEDRNEFAQDTVYRMLRGAQDFGFWSTRKPRIAA